MILSSWLLMLPLFAMDPVPPDSVIATTPGTGSVPVLTKKGASEAPKTSAYTMQKPVFAPQAPKKESSLKEATNGFSGPGVITAGAVSTGVGVALVAFSVGANQQASQEWQDSHDSQSDVVGGTGLGLILVGIVTMGYGAWLTVFGD
jgi:hypothetical protein